MKKLLVSLIGALTLSITLPALAGPDWQAIEQARKAKQATKCSPDALVLPLDHGPRALTTPSQNRARQDRYDAQLKGCSTATPGN